MCCRPLRGGLRSTFEAGVVNIWKRAMGCLLRNQNEPFGHPERSIPNPKRASSALQNQCHIAIDLDSPPREPSWNTQPGTKPRSPSNHANTALARAGAPEPQKWYLVVHSRGLRPLPPTPRTCNPQELTERASVGVPEEALQESLSYTFLSQTALDVCELQV